MFQPKTCPLVMLILLLGKVKKYLKCELELKMLLVAKKTPKNNKATKIQHGLSLVYIYVKCVILLNSFDFSLFLEVVCLN